MGTNAGRTLVIGNNNNFIGYYAGYNASQKVDANNSTAIGANSYTTKDNQIVLGDSNVKEIVINGAITSSVISGSTFKGTANLATNASNAYSLDASYINNSTNIITIYNNYTASTSDYTILCNNVTASINIFLPAAFAIQGKWINIKKTSNTTAAVVIMPDTLSLDTSGSKTLNTMYASLHMVSDSNNWWVI